MKYIIYTKPDGGMQILLPMGGGRLANSITVNNKTYSGKSVPVSDLFRYWWLEGAVIDWAESDDEWITRIAAKDVPANSIDVFIVDESEIPKDCTFRPAWEILDGKIQHNLQKVRDIAHQRRRERREAEFKPHDDVIAKQIPGNDAAAAEAARQAIRSKYDAIQSAINAAKTVDAIKAALS